MPPGDERAHKWQQAGLASRRVGNYRVDWMAERVGLCNLQRDRDCTPGVERLGLWIIGRSRTFRCGAGAGPREESRSFSPPSACREVALTETLLWQAGIRVLRQQCVSQHAPES